MRRIVVQTKITNLFEIPASDIADTRILTTVLEGKTVYEFSPER